MAHAMDKLNTKIDCSQVHYMTDKRKLLAIDVQENNVTI